VIKGPSDKGPNRLICSVRKFWLLYFNTMLLFFQWSLFFMKIMILSVPKQHYNNMIITHLLPTITIVRLNWWRRKSRDAEDFCDNNW